MKLASLSFNKRIWRLNDFWVALSIFVITISKGIFFWSKLYIKSRSIFCGGILPSMRTKTLFNCSLLIKYSWVIPIRCSLFLAQVCAYPYPGKSTRYRLSFIRKYPINLVFPGVTDTLESLLWLASVLINDDFPTFDLPIIANSGKSVWGHSESFEALFTKVAERISIIEWKG